MRRYTLYKYNIHKAVRLLSLLILMAFSFSFDGWGQRPGSQNYYISPQGGKDFPQKDVPTLVDTIYIEAGESRDLVVPNTRDYHYIRWYQKNSDGNGTNIDKISNSYLRESEESTNPSSEPSLFWLNNMNNRGSAFSIEYQSDANLVEDSVFCDLSFNVDGLRIVDDREYEYTEPTIGKRYKFYIKNAARMKERLSSLQTGGALDTIYMTVPQGATYVNLQMNMAPENYFWGNNQGSLFSYSVNDGYSRDAENGKLIELGNTPITTVTTVMVYAKTSSWNSQQSPCLAKFVLTPQENSGFMTENELVNYEERNPDKFPKKYEQIGVVDFDYGKAIPYGELSADNNMSSIAVDPSKTTYSFMNPMLESIYGQYEMPEDAYGLYRSANVEDISERDSHGENWAESYKRDNYNSRVTKTYGWYYTKISQLSNKELYDRTYHNTDRDSCGYFYYVNASKEAGRVVTIPIEGTICPNTELTVVAWVADITDISTLPNVNLILRGENKNGSKILHRFTSGDMLLDYENDRANWKQLCYKITLSSNMLASYSDFSIEFQNNTPDSDGGDYAIDDIRIYKTLPNISVRRQDACNSSTLIVSSDYETLMRNMGWKDNPDVLENADLTDPDTRKYRYGIMGSDPYSSDPHRYMGNMYYSVTETDLDNYYELPTPRPDGKNLNDWITLNKSLLQIGTVADNAVLKGLSKSMRVAIPTDLKQLGSEGIPNDPATAMNLEFALNIRAMNDFISDCGKKEIDANSEGEEGPIWSQTELNNAEINIQEIKQYLENDLKCTFEPIQTGHTTSKITIPDDVYQKLSYTGTQYDKALRNQYEEYLIRIYNFLKIPRIHCPWQEDEKENILSLGVIDVANTDLKFKNEIIDTDENGQHTYASGKYHVVVFNAEQVHGHSNDGSVVQFGEPCLLHSPFTVQPSFDLALNTDMIHDGAGCEGYITSIKAELLVEEFDENGNILDNLIKFEEAFSDKMYTFDWFIGDEDAYDEVSKKVSHNFGYDLQTLIRAFRDTRVGTVEGKDKRTLYFTKDDILNSDLYKNEETRSDAELLIKLLGDTENPPQLIVGNGMEFSKIRWPKSVMALAYVPDFKDTDGTVEGSEEGKTYRFCTKPIWKELKVNDSPELSVGFPNVVYTITDVPLRLGLEHINTMENKSVNLQDVPIQKNIVFGIDEDGDGQDDSEGLYLGLPYSGDLATLDFVYLEDEISETKYTHVGKVTKLYATKTDGGKLSIMFNDGVRNHFKEGETYRLLIPVGVYNKDNADSNDRIEGSCGGYAELLIKIVPEYLTWEGAINDAWYNDKNWNQSTEKELHKGNKADKDANGNDPITNAFAPLYFTKVTIDPNKDGNNKKLVLTPTQEGTLTNLDPTKATEDIQYDMAVADAQGTISPYYINNVSEIYFKPEATLMNQHLLTYGKAWVEFAIKNDEKRWMTSPLQSVYAGDIYAPSNNGKQETVAFEPITYDKDNGYSRWQPAFYQKAWNQAISYATTTDGSSVENVEVVKSNWSIEYNDVTVPYNPGKGFYLSVEDVPADGTEKGTAIVRLPKADTQYQYENAPTRANNLSDITRTNPGKLVALNTTDGSYTLDLTSEEVGIYNDNDHFLVGNPYMAYLDMAKFLQANENVLANKYWTIKDGATTANVVNVGTPDVDWDNEATTGSIPPMTAFFVERKDYVKPGENTKTEEGTTSELKVTFNASMTVSKPAKTTPTRSHSATAPVLTLTAERDGQKGRSVITLRDNADNTYQPQEDAVVLLDSELDAPVAYSVAGNRAAQVNALRSIDNIPVGVYNSRKGDVSLTIEGISQLAEPLYLYDSYTRSSTLLESDSYTLDLSGESHGRYYLRSSAAGSIDTNAIAIYSVKNGKVIVSSTEEVRNIKVYSLNGTQIKEMNINTTQHTFNLPKGIYIVRAKGNADAVKTEKVMVR